MVAALLMLVLVPAVLARQVSAPEQGPAVGGDGHYDATAQEAERNRELLEIWKDHVKTLTKERDAAYKELEQFKANGTGTPMAQFGGIETQAIPSPEAAHQIESLQSEVTRLRAVLEEKQQLQGSNVNATNRELQMQFSALQSQIQQLRKELNETRVEKDHLIQEKEKALSQVERMKSEPGNRPVAGQDQMIAENLQKALDIQKKRYEGLQAKNADLESEVESLKNANESDDNQGKIRDLESQVGALRLENQHLKSEMTVQTSKRPSEEVSRETREIRYENETLKARIEKLQAVEKELTSTREYFTPLVKELQAKNQELVSQNQSFSTEISRSHSESDKILQQAQQLKTEQEEATNQIATLKSQLQAAAADRDKYKGMEEEMQRLSSENKTLHQAYVDLETRTKSEEAKFRESASQMAELQARDTELTKQTESYKNSLRTNLTDIKNLKSNFESYLESLVASFDDRQK